MSHNLNSAYFKQQQKTLSSIQPKQLDGELACSIHIATQVCFQTSWLLGESLIE